MALNADVVAEVVATADAANGSCALSKTGRALGSLGASQIDRILVLFHEWFFVFFDESQMR